MAAGEDIAADLGNGSRNTVLGTAFTGVDLKTQLAHAVGHRLAVKFPACAVPINLFDWRAIDG